MQTNKYLPLFFTDNDTNISYKKDTIYFKSIRYIYLIQLYSYFNENNVLNDNQYGLISTCSTEYGALELIDIIVININTNDIASNVFLDLSKAFGTIDHNIVSNKVAYHGLNGSALHLFKGDLFIIYIK